MHDLEFVAEQALCQPSLGDGLDFLDKVLGNSECGAVGRCELHQSRGIQHERPITSGHACRKKTEGRAYRANASI